MPMSEGSIHNTPLAPSVEKAYYRKCIQLKRRLNEIESDNDSKKIKIERLNRSILKMRLERAFLLDEMRKRMKYTVDGSEGSGSEGAVTPPPDRPHRDKRRRPDSGAQAPVAGPSHQHEQEPTPQLPSQTERDETVPTAQINGNDTSAHAAEEGNAINRSAAATGLELSAGPSITEDANVGQLLGTPKFKRHLLQYNESKEEQRRIRRERLGKSPENHAHDRREGRRKYKNAHQNVTRAAQRAGGQAARLTSNEWQKRGAEYTGSEHQP